MTFWYKKVLSYRTSSVKKCKVLVDWSQKVMFAAKYFLLKFELYYYTCYLSDVGPIIKIILYLTFTNNIL